MVAAGRSKSLTTGNIRCGVAAVHEVLGSPALETPVNCHSELMEDPLWNIEPVQLGVKQMCQASVELPSITDGGGSSGCGGGNGVCGSDGNGGGGIVCILEFNVPLDTI